MANLNSPENNEEFVVRDYHHAAKTFTQGTRYTKTPYTGFNFHVNISFNNLLGRLRNIETKDISVLVRAADLPETQFETETLNQYNRKRIVNKRVVYQPIKLEFHDDVANNIRNMWIAYNQHYNADSNYTLNSTWNIDDVYANYSLLRRYGLDSGNSLPFINKIEIFSMGSNQYSKMLLVNPIINSAQFDDHDYSESAKTLSLTLTIEYENIIYSAGTTDQIANFGKNNAENYDQNDSLLKATDLSRPLVNNGSITGQISTPDTAIETTALTVEQIAARQVDTVTGNVSKSNRDSTGNITDDQYNRLRENVVVVAQAQKSRYSFPDVREISRDNRNYNSAINNTLERRIDIVDSGIVSRNNNVFSNGGNISSVFVNNNNNTGINTEVSNSNTYTAATLDSPELVVNPKMPAFVRTPVEIAAFKAQFPPLSSTDPRASHPPYV